jgi:hypothetical protein
LDTNDSIPINQIHELRKVLKTIKLPGKKTEPVPEGNTAKKNRFSFKEQQLKRFTEVLSDNGYLINDNVKLFAERHHPYNLSDDTSKIKWEKSMLSLMTFIYASDKLKLIERDVDYYKEYYFSRFHERFHSKTSGAVVPIEAFARNFYVETAKSKSARYRNAIRVLQALDIIMEGPNGENKGKRISFKEALGKYIDKPFVLNADDAKTKIHDVMLKIVYNNLL